MKKETKKQREKRLNTRLENPIDDLERAIEKIRLTSNIDDASAGSAVQTTDNHIARIKKKDIALKVGPQAKQQRDMERVEFGKRKYDLYRESDEGEQKARRKAAQDVEDKYSWTPSKSWIYEHLKD